MQMSELCSLQGYCLNITSLFACVGLLDTFSGGTPVTDVMYTVFENTSHGLQSLELCDSSLPTALCLKASRNRNSLRKGIQVS